VVREGVGAGGEMTQGLYAHMNNKTIKKKRKSEPKEYNYFLHCQPSLNKYLTKVLIK
jgi:hypothetical protein